MARRPSDVDSIIDGIERDVERALRNVHRQEAILLARWCCRTALRKSLCAWNARQVREGIAAVHIYRRWGQGWWKECALWKVKRIQREAGDEVVAWLIHEEERRWAQWRGAPTGGLGRGGGVRVVWRGPSTW